jgi:hypothetical protein
MRFERDEAKRQSNIDPDWADVPEDRVSRGHRARADGWAARE